MSEKRGQRILRDLRDLLLLCNVWIMRDTDLKLKIMRQEGKCAQSRYLIVLKNEY